MIQAYLQSFWRNLKKHKTRSFISILGLVFSLTCFIPALYWLHYETSYDSFYPDSKEIYRIYTYNRQESKNNDLVSGMLVRKLQERYPLLSNTTAFFIENNDCQTDDVPYIKLRTIFTDSTFLHVFPQKVICAASHNPLEVMNNIVITESVAQSLFGSAENALGKQIKSTSLSYDSPYLITAVVQNPPANTNLSFDALLSHEQVKMQKEYVSEKSNVIWSLAALQAYTKIPQEADTEDIEQQLHNYPAQFYQNEDISIQMMPIAQVRHNLNPDVPFTLNFIHIFIIAGVLLLFSALFNFMNLNFGLFYQRMKEFHLRIVHGASRIQLIQQMSCELICISVLGLLLALYVTLTAGYFFSDLLDIEMSRTAMLGIFLKCGLLLVGIILLCGMVISYRISRAASAPLVTLKKVVRHPSLQHIAIVFQLAASIIFLMATIVIMNQMHFLQKKDLGFSTDNIVYLSQVPPFMDENLRESLMEQLRSIPQVTKITDTGFTPQHNVNPFKMQTNVEWEGKNVNEKPSFNVITTDEHFPEVFDVKMAEGKWFDEYDQDHIVLNEEAARVMGLQHPVGSTVQLTLNEKKSYRVIGVVRDFHTLSLRNPILPTIFIKPGFTENSIYLHTAEGQTLAVIEQLHDLLPRISPTLSGVSPVSLTTLYDQLNYSEKVGLRLFSILALVCLFITLLGIYAIAAVSTQKRRKEIAIRKVMGATEKDIVYIFFRKYIIEIAIAAAFAFPLGHAIMSDWLQSYAYHVRISWELYLSISLIVIITALLSAFGQIWRAANQNPARVIKTE